MSRRKLAIVGQVLPKYYASDRSDYIPEGEWKGYYGTFNREVLRNADREIDFGRFDNDGPDGIPNSGDDDGYVDFLFIIITMRRAPEGFFPSAYGKPTGFSNLWSEGDVEIITDDTSLSGKPIKIKGERGTTQCVNSFERAVGVMAHEFGHALGLPDLYDVSYDGPEDDAAGIGKWGVMGQGAAGWYGNDGPVPFCAWSREQLGWTNIVEITEEANGQVLRDVGRDGTIYRIPLGGEGAYYLIENRQSATSHYDRNIPQDGLLIWYIQPRLGNHLKPNADELDKLVDLVCADGLHAGRDDLDIWSHDEAYRTTHGGNKGDATDVFDGVRFTAFTPSTNPGSKEGVRIENLRRIGTDMIADIHVSRWSGTITERVTWAGRVNVVGDIVVQKGATLAIKPGTVVRFSPGDALRRGTDPDRCEIDIFGVLLMKDRGEPIRFTAEGKGTWVGIRRHPGDYCLTRTDIYVEDCDHPNGLFSSESLDAQRPNGEDTLNQAAYMQQSTRTSVVPETWGQIKKQWGPREEPTN